MARYSEARGRLNHMQGVFFVYSLIASLLSSVSQQWWLSMIWLAAGACVVGVNCLNRERSDPIARAGRESIDLDARGGLDGQAFAVQFLRLSFVIGVAVLASTLAFEGSWLGSVLLGLTAWFLSMLLIPLLCIPAEVTDDDEIQSS
jgi:hypothetical protein